MRIGPQNINILGSYNVILGPPLASLGPDPNQPQRGSHLVLDRDTRCDPRLGWFGSGTEITF